MVERTPSSFDPMTPMVISSEAKDDGLEIVKKSASTAGSQKSAPRQAIFLNKPKSRKSVSSRDNE
jgi:hypothetical protein